MTIPFYQIHSNTNAPNYVDYERPKYWWVHLDNGFTGPTCYCSMTAQCAERGGGVSPWVPVQVNICDRTYAIPNGGMKTINCANSNANQCHVNLDYQGSLGPVSFSNMYRPCKCVTDACNCTVTGIVGFNSYITGDGNNIVDYSTSLCCITAPFGSQNASLVSGLERSPSYTTNQPSCQACGNYWNNRVTLYSAIQYSPTAGQTVFSRTVNCQFHCNAEYCAGEIQIGAFPFSLENVIDKNCCNLLSCTKRNCIVYWRNFCGKLKLKACHGSSSSCNHRFFNFTQSDQDNPDFLYHTMSFSSRSRTATVCNCCHMSAFGYGCTATATCAGGIFDHVVAKIKIAKGDSAGLACQASCLSSHCVEEAIYFPISCLQSDNFITRGTFKKLCKMSGNQFLLTTNGTQLDACHSNASRCCSASTKMLSFDIATGCTCSIRMNVNCGTANNFLNTYTDAIFTSRGTWVVATSLLDGANNTSYAFSFCRTFLSEFTCDFATNLATLEFNHQPKRTVECTMVAGQCGPQVVNLAYDKYDDSVIVSIGQTAGQFCTLAAMGMTGTSAGQANILKLPSCLGLFCQYLCENCKYNGARSCTVYCCCCHSDGKVCLCHKSYSAGIQNHIKNTPTCCVCAQRTVFVAPTINSTNSYLMNCRDYKPFLQRLGWSCVCDCVCVTCLCNSGMATYPIFYCKYKQSMGNGHTDLCCGCLGVYHKNYTSEVSPAISYRAFCVECS